MTYPCDVVMHSVRTIEVLLLQFLANEMGSNMRSVTCIFSFCVAFALLSVGDSSTGAGIHEEGINISKVNQTISRKLLFVAGTNDYGDGSNVGGWDGDGSEGSEGSIGGSDGNGSEGSDGSNGSDGNGSEGSDGSNGSGGSNDSNGSGSSGWDGSGGSVNRIGAACSKRSIDVFQGQTAPMPNGIPTYTVEVQNICVSGHCTIANIHLNCGWFSSARLINPSVFRRLSYNDCLVNNGQPLGPGQTITFQYANTYAYPMAISSVACF
ncbi:protein TAPETUM DETERMINANT 1-like [Heracleum sosnowskyi]|uniref:Protein TAPETUM DETERMINANT 1-like n=1 Tax=Heracleum sosnowskyi TaxID=360622 RepID=A0AAD8GNA6_9APIA|nr:protein TAPETUM DETERMINANT 1-like [Heracleum sosnowskyi]